MKVLTSQKYKLRGFFPNSGNGNIPSGWVLEELPKKNFSKFTPSTVILSELKYVDGGRVYFLERDGSVRGAELAFEVNYLA